MRKFGNQPLYPATIPAPAILVNPSSPSSIGQLPPTPTKSQPKRRMKAFTTPRPLNIPSQVQSSSVADTEEQDAASSFNNYAAFLNAPETNNGDDGPEQSSILPSAGKISARRSSLGKFNNSPLLGSSLNPAISINSEPGSGNENLVQKHAYAQKVAYLNSKKAHAQPLLASNLKTSDGDAPLKLANGSRKSSYRRRSLVKTQEEFPFNAEGSGDQNIGLKDLNDGEKMSAKRRISTVQQVSLSGQGQGQGLEQSGSNSVSMNHDDYEYDAAKIVKADYDNDGGKKFLMGTSSNVLFDFSRSSSKNLIEEVKISRGTRLSSMIRLDTIMVELFHMDEYDYEKYMGVMRSTGCSQASTQTFDDRMEESTQTDPQDVRMKWTQKPPGWFTENNAMNLKQKSAKSEAIGVGDDTMEPKPFTTEDDDDNDNEAYTDSIYKDREKLNKFLFSSCRLMLAVLSSEKALSLPTGKIGSNSKNLVKLGRSFNFLQGLKMHSICCDGDLIACCNGPLSTESKTPVPYTIITVWTLKEPSVPLYFLRVFSAVTSLEMYSGLLVVVGCKDGSINFFNVTEAAHYHQKEENQTIRAASINTSCMEILNHQSAVVGLAILPETKNCLQVLSMDKDRFLISWTLFLSTAIDLDQCHSSIWSRMKLKIRTTINLPEMFSQRQLEMLSLRAWQTDSKTDVHFMFGSNFGFIGKGVLNDLTSMGRKTGAERYFAEPTDNTTVLKISSIDLNFQYELFAGACEDEHCRLFTFSRKQAILALNCRDSAMKVRWSKKRGSLIYLGFKNRIEMWDLLSSDVLADNQINFKDGELLDFEIFSTNVGEFIIILTPVGLCLGSPPVNVTQLSPKDESRFQMYIKMIN